MIDFIEEDDPVVTSLAQTLEKKVNKYFGEGIKIQKVKTKRGSLLFSADIDLEEAFRKELSLNRS